MAVTVRGSMNLTVEESFTAAQMPNVSEGARIIKHAALNADLLMSATTTPDAESVSSFQTTIDGTDGIDLTALPATLGGTFSALGKKVRAVYLVAGSSNAGAITLAEGASNGYALLGAGWTLKLSAGQRMLVNLGAGAPDVAAGDKAIDVTGTNGDTLSVLLVIG